MSGLVATPGISLEMRARLRDVLISPVQFTRKCLMADTWSVQNTILNELNKPSARVAAKACHASGKTFTAAAAALHFLARWDEAIVITTAPTWNQVESILWPEIWSAIARSWYPWPKPLNTELHFGPKRFAMGFATSVTKKDEGIKFQGFHARHILIIKDEAPGVDPKIWEAGEGIRSGGDVRILALGNPTIPSGNFFNIFQKSLPGWFKATIGAFDTPNLQGLSLQYESKSGHKKVGEGRSILDLTQEELNDNPRPYLITRRWVREMYDEWGPDNPLFESRVLGEFPSESEYSLIPLAWLERCLTTIDDGDGIFRAGIDVAGPGEAATVLCIRRGQKIVKMRSYANQDPRGDVLADLEPFKHVLRAVNVDSIGIGYNFGLHIRDCGYPVNLVNVQESATPPVKPNDIKFANKKAEYYWNLRTIIKDGAFCGDVNDKTKGQLTAIQYRHNHSGAVEIETKDDLKRRGIPSPDEAEAVMLAYANVQIEHAGVMDWYREQAGILSGQKREEKAA